MHQLYSFQFGTVRLSRLGFVAVARDEPLFIPGFPFDYQSVFSLIQIEPFMLVFEVTFLFLVITS